MPKDSLTSSPRPSRRLARSLALGAALTLGAHVATAAAASPWGVPQALVPTSSSFTANSAVGQNADGVAVAVFRKSEGGHYPVYAAIRPAGGTFSTATRISATTDDAAEPIVDVDASGNATVVWRTGTAIKATYRSAGGTFSTTPQTLVSTGIDPGTTPDLAIGKGGFAAIAWTGDVSGMERVTYAIRSAGATTFAAAVVAPPIASGTPTSIFGSPRIAADDTGNLTMIWQQYLSRGDTFSHYVEEASTKPQGATAFGTPVELSQDFASSPGGTAPGTVSTSFADVQMTSTGGAIAVWDFTPSGGSGTTVIQYSELVPGATFATAKWASRQTLPGSSGGAAPAVALDGKGGAAIAYGTSAGFAATVRTTAAGAFQTAKLLSGANANLSGPPATAMTPAGDAVVAWTTNSFPSSEVDAARLTAGQDRFGDSVVVAAQSGTGGASFSYGKPAISLDGEGNGTLVSTLYNDNGAKVQTYTPYAIAFDPVAPALGSVSVPAAGTTGASLDLSASATDRSGTPTVTWDFGDGTTATGAAVSHVYAAPGAFTVIVRATDAAGNVTSATKTTLITAAVPPVVIVAPPGAQAPLAATPIVKLPVVPAGPKLKTSKLKSGDTRLTSLTVSPLLAGDVVTVACAGKGCTKKASSTTTFKPKKTKKTKKLPTSLSVSGLAKLTLKPGATLTVTIARTGFAPSVTTFTIVKGKAPKKG